MQITLNDDQWIRVWDWNNPEVNRALTDLVLAQTNPHNTTPGLSYNLRAQITQGNLDVDHSDPRYSPFFDHLKECLADWVTGVLGGRTPFQFQYPAMWGVRYELGGSAATHKHGPTCCSFAYYAQAHPGSSPLVFDDIGKTVEARTGRLVMFPGWLAHSVPEFLPQDPSELRVVIAGNISTV